MGTGGRSQYSSDGVHGSRQANQNLRDGGCSTQAQGYQRTIYMRLQMQKDQAVLPQRPLANGY